MPEDLSDTQIALLCDIGQAYRYEVMSKKIVDPDDVSVIRPSKDARLTLITCYPTYGGSGIVATELGMELAARGHEVHFITYANPIRLDPETPRIHYHEVEVSNYPLFQYPPYCLALASRMAEVAESYKLDVLHVHYAIPHSIAAMLAQQMMAPARRLPASTTPGYRLALCEALDVPPDVSEENLLIVARNMRDIGVDGITIPLLLLATIVGDDSEVDVVFSKE